jgi:hypothetical protein
VALSCIVDVLSWRHALENSQNPNFLRIRQRLVSYPKFLDKLDEILSSGDIGEMLFGFKLEPTWACGWQVVSRKEFKERTHAHHAIATLLAMTFERRGSLGLAI